MEHDAYHRVQLGREHSRHVHGDTSSYRGQCNDYSSSRAWRKNGSGWWDRLRRDGEWILDDSSEHAIIDELEGNDSSKEGWKERLKYRKGESEPVERWERENHTDHKASVVSIFRYGNIFNLHESYRKLANSNLKILMILGENDSVFPPEYVKRGLSALSWKKDVKLMDGAGHGIVRTHSEEVAGLMRRFGRCVEL
ncbi:hypothetical protein SS1G_05818 [Sclerotinia sclerotiorum 1980 UF-70]|uniref:Uncharacterized protein n=2 Tax=Sclerotinia sclerotiorum (strain ATCC 18683 / 1980 / Ss-1) TaxID=665079 RepID=A7EKH1_SCLS1|nr:hypothetical protein SS1G_05818 [Sclerotinia sclerotiorum 1980 UF-70]APA09926.1 hypothetical protein sscle_05g046960 [Sclerotinia sclerotiorum 1980 UF-70]EDO03337.1 hypothetical protein SS1G_05818 [Sclerotinia sclerotiorum 1980 UF-70]